MISMPSVVLDSIALMTAIFLVTWYRSGTRHSARRKPTVTELLIGFVTNFFDALGIGSFLPLPVSSDSGKWCLRRTSRAP
jgi:hypothetical protein